MQQHALTPEGKMIFASDAKKKSIYYCLSCRLPVRARQGLFRTPHYYHLTKACASSSTTSLEHRQVQRRILALFGPGSALMEKQFPSINRTADIALPSKNLIFEVQCSPISKEEVKQRNLDYGSLGFKVVWILHDQTFNRTFLSSAEQYLFSRPHYYTNIDQEGKGIIYDQFALYQGMRRIHKGKALQVHLIHLTNPLPNKSYPGELGHQIKMRINKWGLSFQGDLYERAPSLAYSSYNPPLSLTRRVIPFFATLKSLSLAIRQKLTGRFSRSKASCPKKRYRKGSRRPSHFL